MQHINVTTAADTQMDKPNLLSTQVNKQLINWRKRVFLEYRVFTYTACVWVALLQVLV